MSRKFVARKSKVDDDDDLYVDEAPQRNPSTKRKRAGPAVGTSVESSGVTSVTSSAALSFPLLSDDEPSLTTVQTLANNSSSLPSSPSSAFSSSASSPSIAELVTHHFHCVSKHLFALTDESRDRGSAKIAVITVELRHPSFVGVAPAAYARSSPADSLSFTSSFKIDGRKSFSNAPFKKYYTRGIHAAWFAEPTTMPASPALSEGRVLMLLSQRAGRPNGKGFTGLKHDPSTYTPKHPLLCLSSNSVEYYVSVFVNRTSRAMAGEGALQLDDWTEVEVDVSARFDAGEVTFESVALPDQAPLAKRLCVQPIRRTVVAPIILPPTMPMIASGSRPSSTTSSESTPSVDAVCVASVNDEEEEDDAASSDLTADDDLPSQYDSRSTPLHLSQDSDAMSDATVDDFTAQQDQEALQLADLSGLTALPDEFISADDQAHWSWSMAAQPPVDALKPFIAFHTTQAAMLLPYPSSPAFAASSLYPHDSLPTAADHERVLEDRALKCAKLAIDHTTVEPLFLAHQDWTLASPTVPTQPQAYMSGPVCSPLPDFPSVYSSFAY